MPKTFTKEEDIVFTCPLGSVCEEIKDNKLHRCLWYTKVAGVDVNTGKDVDEWSCAISWLPILQIELSNTHRQTSAALESFRNETVKGQKQFNQLMSTGQAIALGLKEGEQEVKLVSPFKKENK